MIWASRPDHYEIHDLEDSVSGGAEEGLRIGMAITAFGLGLRHGVDWDHIAAITDLSGSAPDRRKGLAFAMLYAGGHGLVVLALGLLVIAFGAHLPDGADLVMERVVGVTLVALGAWVLVSLLRQGRDFTLRSRWSLIAATVGRLVDWWRRRSTPTELVVIEHEHPDSDPARTGGHSHAHLGTSDRASEVGSATIDDRLLEVATSTRHVHIGPMPADPFTRYGSSTAFGVGMLHGIGAETPTQIIVLGAAAGAGGGPAGVLFLVVFLAGLFSSNTLLAIASVSGLLQRDRSFPIYAALSVVVAVFSLALGFTYLFGQGDGLPPLLGGRP